MRVETLCVRPPCIVIKLSRKMHMSWKGLAQVDENPG